MKTTKAARSGMAAQPLAKLIADMKPKNQPGPTKDLISKRPKPKLEEGKNKPLVKSATLRAKESEARVMRQFEAIRKIPGYKHATKAEILVAAHRFFHSASFQNTHSLRHYLMQKFLRPLHYSVGQQLPVSHLREKFFGLVEQVNAALADQFRQSPDLFDWFALGRLEELQTLVQASEWGIKLLEIIDHRPAGPFVCKVNLNNGRAFLCDNSAVGCLEPHPAFNGDQSVLVNHADTIMEFIKAGNHDEPADLRFDLTQQDRVFQLTFFNVAWAENTPMVETLIGSAVSRHFESQKS